MVGESICDIFHLTDHENPESLVKRMVAGAGATEREEPLEKAKKVSSLLLEPPRP